MARFNNPLDHVSVAAPCPADWDGMIGSDRVRYCGQCKLNVYNLSEMSRREAESLIEQTEGRLCVRFYRRADGTIINRNCPVGLRALKRRLSRIGTALISALMGFVAGLGFNAGLSEQELPTPRGYQVMGAMVSGPPERVPLNAKGTPPAVKDEAMIGKIAYEDAGRFPVGKRSTRVRQR
ncbi:MAG: hypothetical protein QOD00_4108 [Blastocatellia bacterium]|nr:hypothetical protein [Blastocatellia bacterium]